MWDVCFVFKPLALETMQSKLASHRGTTEMGTNPQGIQRMEEIAQDITIDSLPHQ